MADTQRFSLSNPVPSLGNAVVAFVDALVSPKRAIPFVQQTSALGPVIAIASLQCVWYFVAFSPSTEVPKVLMTILVQCVVVWVKFSVLAGGIAALLFLRGGEFRYSELFRAALLVGFGHEVIHMTGALVGRIFIDGAIGPSSQPFTNLSWIVTPSESLPLHHLLSLLDAATFLCGYRLYGFLVGLVQGVERQAIAQTLSWLWLAYLAFTTSIKWYVS